MSYSMGYKFLWFNSIVIFSVVVAMSFQCWKIENVKAIKQQTILAPWQTVVERVFLQRKKRFLIFEKGAAMSLQGNIAKSIIAGMPRGLNEIAEYTLSYDLPWKIETFPSAKKPIITKMSATSSTTTTSTNSPLWTYEYGEYPTWSYDTKWQTDKKPWCPKRHIFKKFYDSYGKNALPWCRVSKYKRNTQRREPKSMEEPPNNSTLLFDVITQLADMHGLNARHCIMRFLCESQHLLFPPGRLLFHDLMRILLSHAQPYTERHEPFRAAIYRENLQECTQLYGLHCRWSFLQYFTESIATAANSMAISPMAFRSIQHIEFM